jgi:AraC-like DNA-binding protein/drug/metabolite transporter (DMT)-like permease
MSALFQHLYIVVTASGVILGLFFAAALMRPQEIDGNANKLLAAIFACFSLSIFTNTQLSNVPADLFSVMQGQGQRHINIRVFIEPFILLVGPFFYCYIHLLANKVLTFARACVHFLPFLIAVLYDVLLFQQLRHSISQPAGLLLLNALVGFAVYSQLWVYYIWNRRLLRVYTEQLKQSCSSIEKVNQSWISYILAVLLGSYTLLGFIYWRSHTDQDLPVLQMLAMILSGIVFVLTYRLLRQPTIFAPQTDPQANNSATGVEQKYQKSGLGDQVIAEEYKRLEELMADEKPYIDAELNLQGLAERMQLSAHHLSQVINHSSQSNFYEYVNEYRVREVQQLILETATRRATMLSLAYAAGFNSKATFNRFFKKVTGKTPTQFRREVFAGR